MRPTSTMKGSWIATAERWTLGIGLFILPLVYWPGTYDRWVLPKLLVGRLLVLVLAALWVTRAIASRAVSVRRSPIDLAVGGFVVSAALSTVFAVNVNVAIFGTYMRYDGLLTLATYAALFWLALQVVRGPEGARSLLRTLIASAYAVSAVAIAMWCLAWLAGGDASHAYGTLGQWNVLGSFLDLAWPLVLWELAEARTWPGRILAANAGAVIGLALMLSFSRSAWAAGLLATIAMGTWYLRQNARLATIALGALVAIAGIAIAAVWLAGGDSFTTALAARAGSMAQPESWAPRLVIWQETLHLIASSPVVGYGPDTFGLVFPRFNTGYHAELIDKAHAETLQVFATQGLLGVAAYVWIVVAFALACWRRRGRDGAFAVLVAGLAYQATLQVNFTAIGSALPFWVFAAAAMNVAGAVRDSRTVTVTAPAAGGLGLAAPALAAAAVAGVVLPYIADTSLLAAVSADRAGDTRQAEVAAAEARLLEPHESVYAVEVANVAFEHGDWGTAREAYTLAAALGTDNALVYRNLAVADRELGRTSEGLAAARTAYDMNPADPVNQAVLAQFAQGRNAMLPTSDSQA